MKLTTFRIPPHHFEVRDKTLLFRHAWLGNDVFFIVPLVYVVSFKPVDDGWWRVRISEAYFNRRTDSWAA